MEHAIGSRLGLASRGWSGAARPVWLGILRTWLERSAQRHALRQLDDHLLADVGLTRAEAEAEAGKPFWSA